MNKFILSICTLLMLFICPAIGQNHFKPGEDLKYVIYFGPVNAGAANIHLSRVIHNNEMVYYSKLLARSTGLADKLYRVKDTFESYFDSVTILPETAIRDVKEGKYKKKNFDTYNHTSNSIFSIHKGEIKMSPGVRDVVSAFYYIRNWDFSNLLKGDIINVDLFFDEEFYSFQLHYLGKEKVNLKTREINCLKLKPVMVEEKKETDPDNISPTPKDEMTVWLSDDPNHIPVRVKFDLFIGSIKADLIEYINLKY